jgi:hypothetical protein
MCCQRGLLRHVISVLEFHAKLNIRSIKQMLRLIQSLGSHSITAAELKLILRLMRDTNDEEVLYEIGFCHGSFNVIEKKKNNVISSFRILRTCSTACRLWPKKTLRVRNAITTLTSNMKRVILRKKTFK